MERTQYTVAIRFVRRVFVVNSCKFQKFPQPGLELTTKRILKNLSRRNRSARTKFPWCTAFLYRRDCRHPQRGCWDNIKCDTVVNERREQVLQHHLRRGRLEQRQDLFCCIHQQIPSLTRPGLKCWRGYVFSPPSLLLTAQTEEGRIRVVNMHFIPHLFISFSRRREIKDSSAPSTLLPNPLH